MKRKKRKLKKSFKFLMIICLLIVTFFISKNILFNEKKTIDKDYNKQSTEESPKPEIDYKEFITDSSETNKDKVKEYIANGMSFEDFKATLSKIAQYVEKSPNKYQPLEYNFERHYKYEELEELWKSLNNSDIVRLEVIGESVDGRNIYSIEVGTGKDAVMYSGNIHGAEIAPTLFLTKFAIDLVNEWENKDEKTKELLSNHKIIILPSINPDTYSYSIYGKNSITDTTTYIYQNDTKIDKYYYKANLNGVDLNRNLPTQTSGLYFVGMDFSSTSTSRTKSPKNWAYYPGESVGSEPETRALIYWMYKNYRDSHAYIDIHSAGRVIYSGKQWFSDKFNELSDECAKVIKKYTDYSIEGIDYSDDGRGTDGNTTDMIGELAHGLKYSSVTGRLSYEAYGTQFKNLEHEMCAITVETLTNYTQDLQTIKEEYIYRKLDEALIEVVRLK